MNKLLLATALSAALLAPLAAQADSTGLFISAQLGKSNARIDAKKTNTPTASFKKKSTFQNVTLGWRWNGMIGPEIGYTKLSRVRNKNQADDSLKTKAVIFGVNGRYGFAEKWYAMGHAGFMRTTYDGAGLKNSFPTKKKNNGWYAGVGVGYDITPQLSVGINYDYYRLKLKPTDAAGILPTFTKSTYNVGAYSVALEYRF